jgi:Zinc finger C-x8-C-x5-C-x3-H type (and similar)/RNA-binding, Nab2-type zinc finger
MEKNRSIQTHQQGNPPTSHSPSNHNPSRPPNFRTRECKYWTKGSCDKGDSCTYKHPDYSYASVTRSGTSAANNRRPANREPKTNFPPTLSPQLQQVCVHFIMKGFCKFGDDCKFTHVNPGNEDGEAKQIKDRPETLLFNLKGIMKSFSRSNQFNTLSRFEEFLEVALKVLDSDEKEVQAEAVVVLTSNDDDSGHKLIRHVVEHVGSSVLQNPLQRNRNPLQDLDYDRHLVPFMKIVVHDAFARSCVEQSFLFVIKAIYGPDGERAIKFLKKVVGILESKIQSCDIESIKIIAQEGCFLICRILHYLVRYNAQAIGHGALIDIHARLRDVSTDVRTPLSARTDRYLAETSACLIPVTIKRASERISSEEGSSLDVRYQQHELLVDLPGELSTLYPRHDNDSARIAKIGILPTKDEVLCARDPYLPINDISAPHFLDGPSRLFDINFRLLREDMIGPLRNAVNTILQKIRPNAPISKLLSNRDRLHEPNIAATRLYFDVSVQSAIFDKKCGLKFQLRFCQPRYSKDISLEARKNYWEATRSLDKGSLLCLISNAPDFVCFLTVVEKDPKLLTKDQYWCLIDVIPEGKVDNIREILLQNIRRNRISDSLALVEFPGILLVAYKAILESLQARSKRPYLPFSNILCPTVDERQNFDLRNRTIKVSPPLYASSEEFIFDLQPLKNKDASPEPLLLSSHASLNDQQLLAKLERETTLDSGQCKGLITALTQEVALIQGEDLGCFFELI